MKYRLTYIYVLILSISHLFIFPASGETKYKQLQIFGLKIHNEKDIIKNTRIGKLLKDRNQYRTVARKIERYLYSKGYTLAKVYPLEETDKILAVYVDEGSIMRIIYKKLNAIDIIKMKYEFDLQDKIYNKNIVDKELQRIKKKYRYKAVRATLQPAEEGDKAFIQLDKEFYIPGIGLTRLPFFKEHAPRYNLIIRFTKYSRTESKGVTYGIKTNYSNGLIPDIEYNYPNFIYKKDHLMIGASFGVLYGLDFKFKEYPKWTFIETHSEYDFAPTLKDYFTPMTSISAYYSRSSRIDIGLLSYNYLLLNGILAPGITLLKRFKIYAGLGFERVFIYTPEIDEEADYVVDVKKAVDTWAIFESKFKFKFKPPYLKDQDNHQFEIIYNYYTNERYFYSVTINLDGEFEFHNLDYYLYIIQYTKLWKSPPFYHEYSVSDAVFKGFMGKSYHTRNVLKFSNEYKISIYKDSLHIGIFVDAVRFEGSGYDLSGYQHGIVTGPAGHIIFLDQFEFNIFFGKDYLFSTKESQYDLYFNAKKKW